VVQLIQAAYEAPGWGVGELWLDGDRPVWHELPRAGATGERFAHPLVERLVAYFAGEEVSFDDVELELEGTPFQQELARALRGVPRGEVVTYGELAALAGRPGAARAAGTFCAQNALPIFVPCHRVVASTGLGSYGSSGVEYKRRLLALEGVSA
jgi:methylated-DNA-[protein]-cysteine S-methyltransferase